MCLYTKRKQLPGAEPTINLPSKNQDIRWRVQMRRAVRFRSLSLAVAAVTVVNLAGEARASDISAVLELFTSQGCALCPRADSLLAELAKNPAVIALSLPVTYWNYIGWKDTLALPAFSTRQKDYAAARGDGQVYTPQVVVDGVTDVVGSNRAGIERAMQASAARQGVLSVPLQVAKINGVFVGKAGAARTGAPKWGSLLLLQIAKKRVVTVRRGENAGHTLTYTNVVRSINRIGVWNGRAMHFALPAAELGDHHSDGYVVILQSGTFDRPSAILAAVKSPAL